MTTPDFERHIGIDTYLTDIQGIGGKLRANVDDFRVTELFLYPPKKENGIFTIAEVSARNWETHTLVQEIAHHLHLSQRRISFAGTKDKRSWSTQLMSFDHVPMERLSQLNINDVTIKYLYQSDAPVRIGSLLGNRFDLTIRDISESITIDDVQTLLSPVLAMGGFPNYYGVQRFGVIRPITHLVGKYIVNGDFENAVMTYIAHPVVGEHESTFALRADLERTRDYSMAFHSYPDSLHFEKAILNKLIQDPNDFVCALQQLPKNLLLMLVNAYESLLFNKILSERIRRNIPIHQAIVGDIIAPVKENLVFDEFIPVSATNLEKVNTQISKKKAVVTGLLLGYDSIIASGEMGEIEQAVIDAENIDPRDFIIPEIPYLSSSGFRRAVLGFISSFNWSLQKDESNKHRQALRFQFELQKGCYATSLLREIMKSSDPKYY